MTCFMDAVNNGNLKQVQGEDVSIDLIHSGLVLAVSNNDIPIATYLLSKLTYFTRNVRDKDSKTLLMIAVQHSYDDMIGVLLPKLIHYKMIDEVDYMQGHTALMIAAMENNLPIVQCLLSRGANANLFSVIEYNALMYAIHYDHYEVAEELIHHTQLNEPSRLGEFPLSLAIDHMNYRMMDLLFQHKKLGRSIYRAMNMMVFRKDIRILHMMLKNDIHKDITLTSLLVFIVKQGWEEGLYLTLQYHEKMELNQYHRQETALHAAISNQSIPMIKLLLDYGADVNFCPPGGLLPLVVACMNERCVNEAVYLISRGANVNQLNKNDNHPESILMIAISAGNYELIPILLMNGVKIPSVNILQTCLESISFHPNYIATKQMVDDIMLAIQSTPMNILKDLFNRQIMRCTIWTKLLLFDTRHALQQYVATNVFDQISCYVAVFEGEDRELIKYRRGDTPNFATSKLRGIMRPMGNRHVRKLLVSYLVHPTRTRHLLTTIRL